MCQICADFTPYIEGCTYSEFGASLTTTSSGASGIIPPLNDRVVESGDAADNTNTSAELSVNGVFAGTLDGNSDSDWIQIELQPGTYTIAAVGTGPLDSAVNDIFLRLRDDEGFLIDGNDDDGPGLNSHMTFTVNTAGTYYIDLQNVLSSDEGGTYSVSLVEGEFASYDDEMAAGNLLRPNSAWTSTPGQGITTVTWGVRANGDANGEPLEVLTEPQTQMVTSAMFYVEAVTNLDFLQVNLGGTTDHAAILIGGYSADDGAGAFAYFPGSPPGQRDAFDVSGDIWLNNLNGFGAGADLSVGGFAYFAMLHEIGHALGLAHPGDYNASESGEITYGNDAQYQQDTHQYTVMSYFDGTNSGGSGGLGYPDTFMLHDYLALHQLYGADTGYNAGDTTYGFNASGAGLNSSIYDFSINTDPFLTIYDGTGVDTINLSNYTMGNTLNLNPGVLSSVGGYIGNLSIAYGAEIENATGGSGNDTITGNVSNNTLFGRNGNDRLSGENGADVVIGGNGADWLIGGGGDDTVIGGNGADRIFGRTDDDFLIGGEGRDTILGGGENDRLVGEGGNDQLNGEIGNDSLSGGAGIDRLWGSDGSDLLNGNSGNDILFGGNDTDTLIGEAGADALYGGAGNDFQIGGSGADLLAGQAGDDQLAGGGGNDTLQGGGGSDTLFGQNNNDFLAGGAGIDTLLGGGGSDRLFGGTENDFLLGGLGNDTLVGEGGNDRLIGENGNDVLVGGSSNDTLFGGAGVDRLSGGFGNDIAVGGADNDTLWGSFGNDFLNGNSGNDRLFGEDGADILIGENGRDTLFGGSGGDTLIGGSGNDGLFGQAGNDQIAGGFGNDVLIGGDGADRLLGEAGNDFLRADAGNDGLAGGDGQDTLQGGMGQDTLNGGQGDDLLQGQANGDVFIFDQDHGNDTIADFETNNGSERIDLSGINGLGDLRDVLGAAPGTGAATQVGADVVIDTGTGSITLLNVNFNSLGADDFIF